MDVHISAIDGFRGKIVGFVSMPMKNCVVTTPIQAQIATMCIYKYVYDLIRVHCCVAKMIRQGIELIAQK